MHNNSNRRLRHYSTNETEPNNIPEGKKEVNTNYLPYHLEKETAMSLRQAVKPTPATTNATPKKSHGTGLMQSVARRFCL